MIWLDLETKMKSDFSFFVMKNLDQFQSENFFSGILEGFESKPLGEIDTDEWFWRLRVHPCSEFRRSIIGQYKVDIK